MKLELEVKDSKAPFVLELLKNFSFIKTKKISPSKQRFLKEFEEAVDEMTLIEKGKKRATNIKDVIDGL